MLLTQYNTNVFSFSWGIIVDIYNFISTSPVFLFFVDIDDDGGDDGGGDDSGISRISTNI